MGMFTATKRYAYSFPGNVVNKMVGITPLLIAYFEIET